MSRPALAAAEIEALDRLYAALLSGDTEPYLAACRRDCVNLGRQVQLLLPDGTRQPAVAEDLDEDFRLVVRMADGSRRTVHSGEVSDVYKRQDAYYDEDNRTINIYYDMEMPKGSFRFDKSWDYGDPASPAENQQKIKSLSLIHI